MTDTSAEVRYDMHAIPTMYSGIRFRSRLEAKWAAFFDICGWRWEYEPFDLNGWMPDFLLLGDQRVLVEVKPVTWMPWSVTKKIEKAMGNPADSHYELMILGCTVPIGEHENQIGWLAEKEDLYDWEPEMGGYDTQWQWGGAILGRWSNQEIVGFCHDTGWFTDRISGAYDGGVWGNGWIEDNTPEKIFRCAANLVQWNSPEKNPTPPYRLFFPNNTKRILDRPADAAEPTGLVDGTDKL